MEQEITALSSEPDKQDAPAPSPPEQLLSIRNILTATDFSDCSARALSYALGVATRYEARLHLFHCIDPTPYNLGAPDAVETACDAARRDMQQLESDLHSNALAKNVELKFRVEAGELGAILPRMVGDLDLGLIVVGTHGRTGWKKLLLGSVAEIVVDKASCPVLTVGPYAYRSQLQHFGPKNILVASDSSVHSKLAESYAFSLAQKYGSRLTVLRVLEDRAGRVIAQASQLEWCGPELRDVVLEKGQTNSLQMPPEIGTRSDLILQAADQTAADLIVLTVPAAHRFADRLRSSNAYRVLCEAPCPVLTVRDQ